MSARPLVIFLHSLLAGRLDPVGPVGDNATLDRLVARPAPELQALLTAHIDALLAGWPGGVALRPPVVPAAVLWVGAALNNLAWAADSQHSAASRPDPSLLDVTLRLVRALPTASGLAAALAYHSLLRHLERLDAAPEWRPVAEELVARSPLTAAWLPWPAPPPRPDPLPALLAYRPVQAAMRDRWLGQAPAADEVRRGLSVGCAAANAAVGEQLARLLAAGPQWQPFVLAFYEADCALQRHGDGTRPAWPLIEQLLTARVSPDPRQRRNAERTLGRYRPLAGLLSNPNALRPYLHLDGRYLEQVGALCKM